VAHLLIHSGIQFVKDWVISLGVWYVFPLNTSSASIIVSHRVFTIFWIFPISLLVGLVSIQNISAVWPSLVRQPPRNVHTPNGLPQKDYLEKHELQSKVLQTFVPTLLVSVLTILIPQLLLFIAKRGHMVVTLSAAQNLAMTRYYKFLVVNVVVFFCIGGSALVSIKDFPNWNVTNTIIHSFPSAAPFYVGWCKAFSYSSLVCLLSSPV